ncbi:hypothetical protein A1704_00245 [Chryseobacterium cucumeris]|uniref:hypothetical protein n=1 Tax=Chryseobacterium cucumeris TaxID=1813611 RepID=UPI000787C2BF|nr:hypothetical protein [Chryseobacterium cucumeris]KYH07145.1 hypothetical protein A1704_00245 [Chryseobacterium cucumeris]
MSIVLKLKESITLEFIKEHLSVIVAVPYIIGGMIQFFALTEISMDLLKFFSLSQLLIDGILLLAKFSLLYFLVQILSVIYRDILFEYKTFSNLYFFILSLLTIGMVARLGYLRLTDPFNESLFYVMNLCLFGFIIIFAGIFIYLQKLYSKIIGITFFAIVLNIIPGKRSNIENFDVITKELKSKYKNVELSYYNDQFLFYETNIGKDDNKIIIKKIDEIFEDHK